jgi:hypothetical protein
MNQASPEVLLILNCIFYPLLCWVPPTVLIVLSMTGRLKLRSPIQMHEGQRRPLPSMRQDVKRDPTGYKAP